MDPEYQNERFITLRIKASVAKDFRAFCKDQETSQSVTLRHMLDFFERNHLNPEDSIPNDLGKVEKRLLERLNAIIGILSVIEQQQTKPTSEMLSSLFETSAMALEEGTSKSEYPATFSIEKLESELRKMDAK